MSTKPARTSRPPRRRFLAVWLCAAVYALGLCLPVVAQARRASVVPPNRTISDFEAERTLASLLGLRDDAPSVEEAWRRLEKLHARLPDDTPTTLEYARVMGKRGDAGNAAALTRRLLERDPASLELHLLLADLEAGQGHY